MTKTDPVGQLRLLSLAETRAVLGCSIKTLRRRIAAGPWWLARADGAAIGLVAGYRTDDDVRHLVSMWVDPAHRGSGAAARLVEAVCRWAVDDGGRVMSLWVADGNDRARRFYERLGFTGTGERQPLPSAPEIGEERWERALGA